MVRRPAQTPPYAPLDSASTHAAGPETPTRVNEFLNYVRGTRTARLRLVAGYDEANDAMNFNGGANGNQTIVIPIGWRVDVSFLNKDADVRHSAVVVAAVKPMPLELPPPAFDHAATGQIEEGLADEETDTMSFVADRAGEFIIVCGVPGHAQGGEWIRLRVSSTATAPAYHL